MKLSRRAKSRLKMATTAQRKKIASATRTLVEFDILSPKRGSVIMRSLAASDPAQTRF